MNNIIPIFTTDSSLGKSILTSDEPKDEKSKENEKQNIIDETKPVNIWSISKKYDINPMYICEDSFVNFISHYKQSKKHNKQLIFGLKFKIFNDAKDKSETSFDTESNVIVWMKNSDGYFDLINLYSEIHGDEDKFYYYSRGDWKILQKFYTPNLLLMIPFYNSFLHRNLLEHNHRAIPEFGMIKPIFCIEDHQLPFDYLIKNSIMKYCADNHYDTLDTHSIYYYKNIDLKAYQIYRCFSSRGDKVRSFFKPEMKAFSQPTFSFESYLERANE